MREIKFRVWNESNEMIYPDGSGYFYNGQTTFVIDGNGELIDLDNVTTPNGILMQYVGLKDKNGVDIYDGDIVKCTTIMGKKINAVVSFNTEHCSYVLRTISKKPIQFPIKAFVKDYNIIGNIYENPNLLQNEK